MNTDYICILVRNESSGGACTMKVPAQRPEEAAAEAIEKIANAKDEGKTLIVTTGGYTWFFKVRVGKISAELI